MNYLPHYIYYIIEFILVVYNIVTAKINSNMEHVDLVNNKTGSIKHGWWGLAYLIACTIAWYFTGMNYVLLIAALFQRKLVFDISYNLFQPRDWYFVNKSPSSIVDKVYNYLFQFNAKLYQAVNLIIFSVLQIWV